MPSDAHRRASLLLAMVACHPTAAPPGILPDPPRPPTPEAAAPACLVQFAPAGSRTFTDWHAAVAAHAVDELSANACEQVELSCLGAKTYCAQFTAACLARRGEATAANGDLEHTYEIAIETPQGVVVLPPLSIVRGLAYEPLHVTLAPPYVLLEQPYDASRSQPIRSGACEPPDAQVEHCTKVLDDHTLQPVAELRCDPSTTSPPPRLNRAPWPRDACRHDGAPARGFDSWAMLVDATQQAGPSTSAITNTPGWCAGDGPSDTSPLCLWHAGDAPEAVAVVARDPRGAVVHSRPIARVGDDVAVVLERAVGPYLLVSARTGDECVDAHECIAILDLATLAVLRGCDGPGLPVSTAIPAAQ